MGLSIRKSLLQCGGELSRRCFQLQLMTAVLFKFSAERCGEAGVISK
jgi:hypothetical protein